MDLKSINIFWRKDYTPFQREKRLLFKITAIFSSSFRYFIVICCLRERPGKAISRRLSTQQSTSFWRQARALSLLGRQISKLVRRRVRQKIHPNPAAVGIIQKRPWKSKIRLFRIRHHLSQNPLFLELSFYQLFFLFPFSLACWYSYLQFYPTYRSPEMQCEEALNDSEKQYFQFVIRQAILLCRFARRKEDFVSDVYGYLR